MTFHNSPLNTAAAARHVGVSKSTLEKLRVYGGGPRYLKLGRLVRYRLSDLEHWLGERLAASTSEASPGPSWSTRRTVALGSTPEPETDNSHHG